MKIGFFESLPVLENKLKHDFLKTRFPNKITLSKVREGEMYDLVLSDQNFLPRFLPFEGLIYLIPSSAKIPVLPEKGLVLTGGMSREDAVSFSSIGEDSALLYSEKEIFFQKKSILPFEKKVPFDRNFSLYKNLASGFALSLATLLFTEEL